MSDGHTQEDTALWQRRLASQANNRAWALAELPERTADQDEEMLQAAHAAMYFWKIVGNPSNRAHAALLLAHVYALNNLPNPAKHYLKQCQSVFLDRDCESWEKAFVHAISANVAAAAQETEEHMRHYQEAERLIASLQDEEDRKILNATMRVIPAPLA
ncbi:MAG TPA: hypothetical protein DIW27_07620 [Cytophagales bacterium]|nr:hypothetical protein [Cytophagales bacterium]